MSVTAAQGIIGFGPQPAKGTLATTWYRHRATMVDLDVADPVLEGPPEVGGIGVPTFPYKPGPMVGGGLTIMPRLEDTFGWLLYGLIGQSEAEAVVGQSGLYDHTFELPSDEVIAVPWMSFRKYVPKSDGAVGTDVGQIFKDCKVIGTTLTLPNDAPISARVDVLGREAELDNMNTPWVWENTYEGWESIPVGCVTSGYIKIDDVEMPIVGANVTFQNVPLDPRQERVFGSPFLEDITKLQSRLSYDLIIKWKNPDLYQKIFSGAADGLTWSPAPYTASFKVQTVSSVNIPTYDVPYLLKVEAEDVIMNLVGGLVLGANQSILMRFQGTALENQAGYAKFILRNEVAAYVWPTPDSSS